MTTTTPVHDDLDQFLLQEAIVRAQRRIEENLNKLAVVSSNAAKQRDAAGVNNVLTLSGKIQDDVHFLQLMEAA